MAFRFPQVARASLVCLILLAMTVPGIAQTQSPVVQPSELKSAIERASGTRQKNLDQVRSFFSSKPVRAALAKTTMNPERMEKAAASLSADELARLAARTQKIQSDFAAGALSNQELTYVIIALVTAVIILVVVVA